MTGAEGTAPVDGDVAGAGEIRAGEVGAGEVGGAVEVDGDFDFDDDFEDWNAEQISLADLENQTFYPTLGAFVRRMLVEGILPRPDGRVRTWCPRWWEHADGVLRLESLWQAWEAARKEGGQGMSCWLRDHADYHLPILLDPDATFRGCSPEKGHQPRSRGEIPWEEPPEGL